MAPPMKWLRLYVEVLDDPKVQRLDPRLFKAWVNLLCLARRHDGHLPSNDDIAFGLRVSTDEVATLLADLKAAGLLDEVAGGCSPHNWHERQKASDNVTARTQKHRGLERADQSPEPFPPTSNEAFQGTKRERSRNVPRNGVEQEVEREGEQSSRQGARVLLPSVPAFSAGLPAGFAETYDRTVGRPPSDYECACLSKIGALRPAVEADELADALTEAKGKAKKSVAGLALKLITDQRQRDGPPMHTNGYRSLDAINAEKAAERAARKRAPN